MKTEAAKDAPDKALVGKIIGTLSRGLVAILAWCARKGDVAVDTLIKWGIPVGAATLLAKTELLKDVIDAAKAWLGVL